MSECRHNDHDAESQETVDAPARMSVRRLRAGQVQVHRAVDALPRAHRLRDAYEARPRWSRHRRSCARSERRHREASEEWSHLPAGSNESLHLVRRGEVMSDLAMETSPEFTREEMNLIMFHARRGVREVMLQRRRVGAKLRPRAKHVHRCNRTKTFHHPCRCRCGAERTLINGGGHGAEVPRNGGRWKKVAARKEARCVTQ